MAEKTLNTRIQLKYDTYANWTKNNPTLKAGELAVVVVPASTNAVAQEPALLLKAGDGSTPFNTLNFVSGTAADVYNWAKAAEKPTYQASEIQGLEAYIAGQIEDTDTQYRIQLSGNTVNLQSKAKGQPDTAYATASTITLPSYTLATGATQGTVSFNGADVKVNGLGSAAYTDSGDYATPASVQAVKTDVDAIKEDYLKAADKAALQGNIDKKQDALSFGTTYDPTSNKAATMADIQGAVGGLTGAMHFRGKLDSIPGSNSGYEAGDVILVGTKEHVFDGTTWHELGDEAMYEPKTDAAAKLEEAKQYAQTQAQEKIAALKKEDSPVAGQVVSAVSQENGVITVTRRALSSSDIPDLAPIATSGNVNDLTQSSDDVLVFYCGTASELV